MNSDAFYTTGRQHSVCQDYAVATPGAVYLSDGCSSTPDSDWGARLLVQAARTTGSIAESIVAARAMARVLDLPVSCLDATLLLAECWESGVRVRIWGDGVVAARHRDGSVDFRVVEAPAGAPDYPSYLLDEERKQTYLQEAGTEKTVALWQNDRQWGAMHPPCFEPLDMHYAAADYNLVVIASDGVRSFLRPEGTALIPVPVHEVLAQVLAVKSTVGDFMVRRVRNGFLNRFCAEHKWQHYDDLAVAAIALEKP